jgi:hypothetical protein
MCFYLSDMPREDPQPHLAACHRFDQVVGHVVSTVSATKATCKEHTMSSAKRKRTTRHLAKPIIST